jgi:hypothetical protein
MKAAYRLLQLRSKRDVLRNVDRAFLGVANSNRRRSECY